MRAVRRASQEGEGGEGRKGKEGRWRLTPVDDPHGSAASLGVGFMWNM